MADTFPSHLHAASAAEALDALDSTRDGLSEQEAVQRLDSYGANRLPPPERPGVFRRILSHFQDVLIYILLAAAALKAVLGDWLDFGVILAVAVINAAVGFIQEGQARKALDGISSMLSLDAQVRRDGDWRVVDAESLVPGDVVRLRSGGRVPADLRILDATNLQVDEAPLTGESVPSSKQVGPVERDAGVGDRASMLFSGTVVSTGSGTGVVTATASATEIGQIQQMVSEADPLETPLSRKLARFGTMLAWGILGMAAFMIVVGYAVHQFSVDELVSAAIGFAVAAVPEGLPALVTVTLALGVRQMARNKAITRSLTSVETLGSVTTICSDKTGTLTTNEMVVRHAVTAVSYFEIEGDGYAPVGRVLLDGEGADLSEHGDLAALIEASAACNDARVVEEDGQWRVVGLPTEGAVASLVLKLHIDDSAAERLAVIPFESEHKYMATLDSVGRGGDDHDADLFVRALGAPDVLLDKATYQRGADGNLEPIDRKYWDNAIAGLAAKGLRTLAAVQRKAPTALISEDRAELSHDDVGEDLVFLGVFGILDPPRPEAVNAIAECHRAGIRVKMITGDHVGTAMAIAADLGITDDSGEARSLTGADLERMSDEELEAAVCEVDVYARTSPEHKIRIVRALQAHDEVVAMTGDGVNDAPALARADVGVAMGIKGTEATKEAADMVLVDDNFATIERAVEEGRRIYDNIRKSVVFLLPTNGAQSLVVLVAILLGFALPLATVQILWVNLVSGVTLSLALAYEKAEPGIMDRPPRASGGSVLSRSAFVHVVLASLFIGGATLAVSFIMRAQNASESTAQTATVTILVLGQLAYLFNCRFLSRSSFTLDVLRGNRALWVAVGSLLSFQMLFTYAPFMHRIFGSTPIGWAEWGLAAAFAAAVFVSVEAMKWVGRARRYTIAT